MVAVMKRTAEDSAIESDLKYWGFHYGKICAADGYPPVAAVARLMEGLSDSFDSKVLIPDMPPRAWRTHYEVMTLPGIYHGALIARYCLPPRDTDGRLYTVKEICRALGCSASAYKMRLSRARQCMKAKIFY